MCTNEALINSLETYLDELVDCFQDFVKKSLIAITVGIGSLIGLLLFCLRRCCNRDSFAQSNSDQICEHYDVTETVLSVASSVIAGVNNLDTSTVTTADRSIAALANKNYRGNLAKENYQGNYLNNEENAMKMNYQGNNLNTEEMTKKNYQGNNLNYEENTMKMNYQGNNLNTEEMMKKNYQGNNINYEENTINKKCCNSACGKSVNDLEMNTNDVGVACPPSCVTRFRGTSSPRCTIPSLPTCPSQPCVIHDITRSCCSLCCEEP